MRYYFISIILMLCSLSLRGKENVFNGNLGAQLSLSIEKKDLNMIKKNYEILKKDFISSKNSFTQEDLLTFYNLAISSCELLIKNGEKDFVCREIEFLLKQNPSKDHLPILLFFKLILNKQNISSKALYLEIKSLLNRYPVLSQDKKKILLLKTFNFYFFDNYEKLRLKGLGYLQTGFLEEANTCFKDALSFINQDIFSCNLQKELYSTEIEARLSEIIFKKEYEKKEKDIKILLSSFINQASLKEKYRILTSDYIKKLTQSHYKRDLDTDRFLLKLAKANLAEFRVSLGRTILEILTNKGIANESWTLKEGTFLLLRLYVKDKDFKSIDRILTSLDGLLNKEDDYFGEYLFYKGLSKYQQKNYVVAEKFLKKSLKYGQNLGLLSKDVISILATTLVHRLEEENNLDEKKKLLLEAESVFSLLVKNWGDDSGYIGLLYLYQKHFFRQSLSENFLEYHQLSFLNKLWALDLIFCNENIPQHCFADRNFLFFSPLYKQIRLIQETKKDNVTFESKELLDFFYSNNILFDYEGIYDLIRNFIDDTVFSNLRTTSFYKNNQEIEGFLKRKQPLNEDLLYYLFSCSKKVINFKDTNSILFFYKKLISPVKQGKDLCLEKCSNSDLLFLKKLLSNFHLYTKDESNEKFKIFLDSFPDSHFCSIVLYLLSMQEESLDLAHLYLEEALAILDSSYILYPERDLFTYFYYKTRLLFSFILLKKGKENDIKEALFSLEGIKEDLLSSNHPRVSFLSLERKKDIVKDCDYLLSYCYLSLNEDVFFIETMNKIFYENSNSERMFYLWLTLSKLAEKHNNKKEANEALKMAFTYKQGFEETSLILKNNKKDDLLLLGFFLN